MDLSQKINNTKRQLSNQRLDGWLFYDFQRSNNLACEFLEIPTQAMLTRRFFYWISAQGEPLKIVHKIEQHTLDHLPGNKLTYSSWQELELHIGKALRGSQKIAMEYSPRNAIPYVSKVDAGTMDVIRGFGVEVVSSADLLQEYTSIWDPEQLKTHRFAAKVLDETAALTWRFITISLQSKKEITEYDVQQFIVKELSKHGCIAEGLPICAVNAHSADPHYIPPQNGSSVIRPNDFILIDLWCKQDLPRAVYADITRVGVASPAPTKRHQQIFQVVKEARDRVTEWLKDLFMLKTPVMGWEVDQLCREIIINAGYGDNFIHRTGHNIGLRDHGSGANIDNLETRDNRHVLPGSCFSIEPGIYLTGEFGVRLEYDIYVHPNGQSEITGGIQTEIVCLL